MLATLTVSMNSDGSILPNDGNLTLREAIAYVNGDAEPLAGDLAHINLSEPFGQNDKIIFDPAVFNTPQTINLTHFAQALPFSQKTHLVITNPVTIEGPGRDLLTIHAFDSDPNTPYDGNRILIVDTGYQELVTISGLTLTGADTRPQGDFILDSGSGGAIFKKRGDLTLIESRITGNQTAGSGAGLYAYGYSPLDGNFRVSTVTLVDCEISGNHARYATDYGLYLGNGGMGGGIAAKPDTILVVRNTTISDNSAIGNGGGVFACGPTSIEDSRINGNDTLSGKGGGIYILEKYRLIPATITGSVIFDNRALNDISGEGGGIFFEEHANVHDDQPLLPFPGTPGGMTVSRSTIRDNFAATGAGIRLGSQIYDVQILDSTISGNQSIPANLDGKGGGVYVNVHGTFVPNELSVVTVRNTTISGNISNDKGGGVYAKRSSLSEGSLMLANATITNNRANSDHDTNGNGGGVYIDFGATAISMENTIVAQNLRGLPSPSTGTTRDDINGAVTASWSLIGDNTGATITDTGGNQIGTGAVPKDAKLSPLVYNGGPVFLDGSRMLTHALLPDSPAINMGDPSIPFSPTEFDQRGAPWKRVVGGGIVDRIDIGAFERQANPLPGDYNFDGIINAADYTVWRDTLGSTTDLRADGDGNRIVDVLDYRIWKGQYGEALADASGNGATDLADYLIWAATYGSTTDLRADCNEDGVVDDADFNIWFDTFGSTLEIAQFGLLSNYFDPDAPPAVVGVALSFPGVGATDFAGKVGSGEQLRSVPLIAANTLSITFSRDVNVSYTDLEILNLDGASPTIFDFDYDPLAQTATWTFNASLANGRYLVRLSDSIESLDGKALDGEFTNPWSLDATGGSIFPSGDGDAGGEFRFRFTVLSGDTDHDNVHGTTNYQNWQSFEPGMIIVSTTADEFDGNLTFGDVSLREAVHYANSAGTATTIQLPAGRYVLTRVGTEGSDTAFNDLDVLSTMTIIGAGAGLSIIDNSGLVGAITKRAFDVTGSASSLVLDGVTIAHGAASSENGLAVRVNPGASLQLVDGALVHHVSLGGGSAIFVDRGSLSIRRSVITNNWNQVSGGAAVYVQATSGSASVVIGETVFALNHQYAYGTGNTTRNVQTSGNVAKTNLGRNLYDDASGGFFNTTPGEGDHLGSVDYVVTSVADTFDHADDNESLSIREAVDLANQAVGTQEIWIPAWGFVLTRDRATYSGGSLTDTDIAYGDLDIKDSLKIHGISGHTSVACKTGVVEEVFELLGDANVEGQADYRSVSSADYTIWRDQYGFSGTFEQFSADADDDGDVDRDDYDLWADNYGHTLELIDVAE